MGEHSGRLDSWKEIATYLDRDVRTAMRWAKDQGLPVRRVGGGRGRSVFAFSDELDAWLLGHPALGSTPPAQPVTPTVTPPTPPLATIAPAAAGASVKTTTVSRPTRVVAQAVFAGAIALTAAATLPSLRSAPRLDPFSLRAVVKDGAVTLSDGSGGSAEIHRFDAGLTTHLARQSAPAVIADLNEDGQRDVMVGVAYDIEPGEHTRNGYLLNLSPSGRVQWKYTLGGTLRFAGETFREPWVMTEWQVSPAPGERRIAMAAHHWTWWPSTLTVLDASGRQRARFVNPGWLESVRWLDAERVAVAGFNNAHDRAVLALLDSRRAEGQAPGSNGTPFDCVECPQARSLLYATFPRSEVNRVTGARFNRAAVNVGGGVLTVTTSEDETVGGVAAVYEFDKDLGFVRSTFSDRYWDTHKRLELEGRLDHQRENCPDRAGPRGVRVWTEATGWQPAQPAR